MPCPQRGRRAPHGADALARDLGGVRFALHRSVDLQHGVAADDEQRARVGIEGVGIGRTQRVAHVRALGLGQGAHLVRGSRGGAREGAPAGKSREDSVLVNLGDSHDRSDSRGDESRAAGGGGGGENEAHRDIVDHGVSGAQEG